MKQAVASAIFVQKPLKRALIIFENCISNKDVSYSGIDNESAGSCLCKFPVYRGSVLVIIKWCSLGRIVAI